jgi:hypothetical protein
LIKRVIDDSDYYVLIIAGKYGSIGPADLSFTEMEFDYACSSKKPILAFLFQDAEAVLPGAKLESAAMKRKKLAGFRKRVEQHGVCKYWSNAEQLRSQVTIAITRVRVEHPSPGWVPGKYSAFSDFLREAQRVPHSNWFKDFLGNPELRRLLHFGTDDVVIVVPQEHSDKRRALPQMAIEDVFALRNVLEALASIGIKHPKLRSPDEVTDADLRMNVICIGGPLKSRTTKTVLEELRGAEKISCRRKRADRTVEIIRNGRAFVSPSFSELRAGRVTRSSKVHDIAVLIREPNPRNPASVVVVLAGVRGIGTWGACDFLRKNVAQLTRLISTDTGDALGVCALLDVEYKNLDILSTKLRDPKVYSVAA